MCKSFDTGVAPSRLLSEIRPTANRIPRFFKDFIGIVELRAFCEGQEILFASGCRSFEGGDMDALSARAGAWSDVVGRGLAPLAGGIHEEAEIFGMVVPVSRLNVEGCASRQFTEFPVVTRDPLEGVGDDLVVSCNAYQSERERKNGPLEERLGPRHLPLASLRFWKGMLSLKNLGRCLQGPLFSACCEHLHQIRGPHFRVEEAGACHRPPGFGKPCTRSPGQMLFFVNHPRGISRAKAI